MTVVAEIKPSDTDPLSPEALFMMREASQATLGMLWVLQAAATIEWQAGLLSQDNVMDGLFLQSLLQKHQARLQELSGEIEAAVTLQMENMGYYHHVADPAGGTGEAVFTHQPPTDAARSVSSMFIGYFSELAVEVVQNQELIKNMEIVMVAGHQGSGKGEVVKAMEAAGYHVLSMSQIVREVVAAWGLRNTETIDKIVGGQLFKEYFGPGILVFLGLQYAASQGMSKVVIDGPRVMEEPQAVRDLGGVVVGIVNDPDYLKDVDIRRQRIEQRALVDKNRAQDVVNFNKREDSEAGRVKGILESVAPSHLIINGPETTLEQLHLQVQEMVESLSHRS